MNRTQSIVSAIVVLVVQIASICGLSLDENAVSMFVSGAAVMAATVYALVKTHNFSRAADEGKKTSDELKAGK